jgi:hypothetical protein
MLVTLRIDPHCRQHYVLAEVHPVNQQRDHLELAQIAAHQFGQFALGAVNEPLAHCALAHPTHRNRFRQRL